jgi:hypothetical protein
MRAQVLCGIVPYGLLARSLPVGLPHGQQERNVILSPGGTFTGLFLYNLTSPNKNTVAPIIA